MQRSPLFVIGPPRGGTTLMLQALGLHPQVLALGEELHRFHHDLGRFPHRHGEDDHFRLTARDATPELVAEYRETVARALSASGKTQLVVKISTLSQQVDYVLAVFPDARFVQCVRDGRDTACSMEDLRRALEAEQDHPRLLGPAPDPLGLWAAEAGMPPLLVAGCSWFYHVTRSYLDLRFAGADRLFRLRYEDLLAAPAARLGEVMRFMGLALGPEQQPAVTATTDLPGLPGAMGFSTSQASGARLARYQRDMAPEVRVLLAPLMGPAMQLMGYTGDPTPSDQEVGSAAAAVGVDKAAWETAVRRELAWFATQLEAFDPVKMLREPDLPSSQSKPLLIDGATYGCHGDVRDGRGALAHAWVRKQNRTHTFADPTGLWPSIAPKLDGTRTLAQACDAADQEVARALCGRLHGMGLIGYV